MLFEAMKELRVTNKLIKLVKVTLMNTNNKAIEGSFECLVHDTMELNTR